MNIKLKLIAASLTTAIAVLSVTQIAGAQKTVIATPSTMTAQASSVDTPEAGDTADAAGVSDPEEAGDTADVTGVTDPARAGDTADVADDTETADSTQAGETPDAAEPTGADTGNVQQGDQSGPETPEASGATTN